MVQILRDPGMNRVLGELTLELTLVDTQHSTVLLAQDYFSNFLTNLQRSTSNLSSQLELITNLVQILVQLLLNGNSKEDIQKLRIEDFSACSKEFDTSRPNLALSSSFRCFQSQADGVSVLEKRYGLLGSEIERTQKATVNNKTWQRRTRRTTRTTAFTTKQSLREASAIPLTRMRRQTTSLIPNIGRSSKIKNFETWPSLKCPALLYFSEGQ